jgi:PAS domain S-box-containing protein
MTTMPESNLSKILSNRKNLERILENLDVGIIAHDLSRKIFYFNEQAEKITGYNREEVLGKIVIKFLELRCAVSSVLSAASKMLLTIKPNIQSILQRKTMSPDGSKCPLPR